MQAKLMQMELIIQTYATLSKHMQFRGGMHLDIPILVAENVGKSMATPWHKNQIFVQMRMLRAMFAARKN